MNVDIETTPENRKRIGKAVAAVINDVFNQGTDITVHWDLSNAEDRYTGVHISAVVHTSGVTREEQEELVSNGLHFVEHYAHVVENPDMDEDVEEVSRDELSDSAETDMEIVLELDNNFIQQAI